MLDRAPGIMGEARACVRTGRPNRRAASSMGYGGAQHAAIRFVTICPFRAGYGNPRHHPGRDGEWPTLFGASIHT
jgi:hypothetical protein